MAVLVRFGVAEGAGDELAECGRSLVDDAAGLVEGEGELGVLGRVGDGEATWAVLVLVPAGG
ncbi:hypothetical protein [Streptomyces sp. P17]|uniref:hypothetical protein n=1 Tax=Streptomyces sp. P17 TaxID=3074716 RepID=UPI0028F3E2EC|nr:hypothetical protein [Streptomyces sp. P17]MDT9698080.1 hypothetical protein [Streptomyces sp. P17]